jgi:hypothetical protein
MNYIEHNILCQQNAELFRRVRIPAKSAYYLRHVPRVRPPSIHLYLCLFVCIMRLPLDGIPVKIDIVGLYENLSRKSRFG